MALPSMLALANVSFILHHGRPESVSEDVNQTTGMLLTGARICVSVFRKQTAMERVVGSMVSFGRSELG